MKTKESGIVWVRIRLHHPSLADHNAEMNFMFDKQPTSIDIKEAYLSEPFWTRHEHCDVYGSVLAQCLATYGVPQLDRMNVADKEGYRQAVPMVTALWAGNIVGRDVSHCHHHFGEIRLTHKAFLSVKSPEPQTPVAAARPKKSKNVDDPHTDGKSRADRATPPRKP